MVLLFQMPEFALYNHLSYPLFCIPRLLCLCRVETLESLPVHSFNGVIISSARVCTLQSPFVFVLRVASGPRVKLASCKSALNPTVVYSTDRSKAVVPVLVFIFLALWFILRGDLLYVFPCVILFLCFSVLLVLRLPRLGKRELILVLFVRLFDLCLFGFVGFLFLLGSGKGCVL